MNWKSCKTDIRKNLLSVVRLDSLIIQIIVFISFLTNVSGLTLIKSIATYFLVFIIAVPLTIIYTIIVHAVVSDD